MSELPDPLDNPPVLPSVVDNTASYHKRFLAFIIDMFLLLMTMTFFMSFVGLEPLQATDFVSAQKEIMAVIDKLSGPQKMALLFAPYASFLFLHGFSLYRRGQTLGKCIMGIAIVTLDNQIPPFLPLIAQRYATQWLIGMVPLVGPILRLADVAMVFKTDKRCFHDHLAKTKVIDVKIAIAPNENSFVA